MGLVKTKEAIDVNSDGFINYELELSLLARNYSLTSGYNVNRIYYPVTLNFYDTPYFVPLDIGRREMFVVAKMMFPETELKTTVSGQEYYSGTKESGYNIFVKKMVPELKLCNQSIEEEITIFMPDKLGFSSVIGYNSFNVTSKVSVDQPAINLTADGELFNCGFKMSYKNLVSQYRFYLLSVSGVW